MSRKRRYHRQIRLEQLESRFAMHGASVAEYEACVAESHAVVSQLQNSFIPTDVDRDSVISPIDALIIVNELNENGAREMENSALREGAVDVDGDQTLSPLDVLAVINELNSPGRDTAVALAEAHFFGGQHTYSDLSHSSVDEVDQYHEDGSVVYAISYCTPYSAMVLLGQQVKVVNLSTGIVYFVPRD